MSEEKRYGAPTGTPVKNLPGSGGVRIGGSNTDRNLPGQGDTYRIGGGGGFGGNGGGNIFKDFGNQIGKNPLGAISNLFNNGMNAPMTNLVRGQNQYWNAQGQLANTQYNYYRNDARRDAARDANGNGMLYDIEMSRFGNEFNRYNNFNGGNRFGGNQGDFRYGAPGQPWPPVRQQQDQGGFYPVQNGGGFYPTMNGNNGFNQQPNYQPNAYLDAQNPYQTQNGQIVSKPITQPPVTPAPLTQTDMAPPATTPTAPAPASTTPAANPLATDVKVEEKPAATLSDATGGKTKSYSFQKKAPSANEIPNIAENQVQALQQLLIDAGVNVGPTGADGRYGPNTHFALQTFAAKHGITDLSSVDFIGKNDASKKLLAALGQGNAPAKSGPSADDIAKEQAAKATADAKAAADAKAVSDKAAADKLAAEDARVPASVRNTLFDPRNVGGLDPQQRYDLARQTLHGLDELSSEKSRPNLERMHDKMDETVRWVNKHMGTNIPRPSPADPLSNDAMYALGLRAAYEGKLSNARGELVQVEQGMTQAQMNHRAVEYIKALDRGVNRDDPSRAIRKFEEKDMGRTGIEVDGLADPQMLIALQQAVAARNGLYSVAAMRPVTPPPAETSVTLPTSVTGGASAAVVESAPVVPNAKPVDAPAVTK